MAITNIPSNLANLVAPFLPAGQKPVGQETAENRNSVFKPVEQAAGAARAQLQARDDETERRKRREGREQPETGRKAPVSEGDSVELYSPAPMRRRGPRGCLFDETV